MRRVLASALFLGVAAGLGGVLSLTLSSPVQLALLRLEPSGVVDSDGNEFWLAHVGVSNLNSGIIQFEWGRTRVDTREGRRWVAREPMEILLNPRYLTSHETRELLLLVPPGADAFRIQLSYQPELFKWRVWHKMGPRGQRLAGKMPALTKRLWPQGNFGERPPWNKGFRIPPQWRRFTVVLGLPSSH